MLNQKDILYNLDIQKLYIEQDSISISALGEERERERERERDKSPEYVGLTYDCKLQLLLYMIYIML